MAQQNNYRKPFQMKTSQNLLYYSLSKNKRKDE